MCCFSQPIISVSDTAIFARPEGTDRQFLVYRMDLAIDSELAMVLPLPVPAGSPEDAIRWINLEDYKSFFVDLKRTLSSRPRSSALSRKSAGTESFMLAVVEVGDFEASFVPSAQDWGRLDPRFRLAPGVLEQLGGYSDWGFAVFKFKPVSVESEPEASSDEGIYFEEVVPTRGSRAARPIQPMAFSFPTRDPSRLYFPLRHVHDGDVHARAAFDHELFLQTGSESAAPNGALDPDSVETIEMVAAVRPAASSDENNPVEESPSASESADPPGRKPPRVVPPKSYEGSQPWWLESAYTAGSYVDLRRSEGLVLGPDKVHYMKMTGELPNEDLWV